MMPEYSEDDIPWKDKKNKIVSIKIEGVVTISSNAFKKCVNLELRCR